MAGTERHEPQGLLTGVNVLTSVNSLVRCIEKTRKTRTIGFRVSQPIWEAYDDLPEGEKASLRLVVESLVYALAKKNGITLQCEEAVKSRLADISFGLRQSQPFILNININNAEARAEAEVASSVFVRLETKAEELRASIEELQARLERVEQLVKLSLRNLEEGKAYLAKTNIEEALRHIRMLRPNVAKAIHITNDLQSLAKSN